MNKFLKLISDNSNETLIRRAKGVNEHARIAQQTIVNKLKTHISDLEIQISNLTDLAPDNKDSLSPMVQGWNANEWAEKLQRLNWDLTIANQQLKIAENTYKEFFEEVKETKEN
jgi:hypothetical protein